MIISSDILVEACIFVDLLEGLLNGYQKWQRYGTWLHSIIFIYTLINSIFPLFTRSVIQYIISFLPLSESAAINM